MGRGGGDLSHCLSLAASGSMKLLLLSREETVERVQCG